MSKYNKQHYGHKTPQTIFMSDGLREVFEKTPKHQRQILIKKLQHYMHQYKKLRKKEGPAERALTFAVSMEKSLEEYKEKHEELAKEIQCKKGCKYCCRQYVLITEDEAELLLKYADTNNLFIDWDVLEGQREYPDAYDWIEMPENLRPCVFLSQDNACRVYEARPMFCRKYLSLDDPSACEISTTRNIRRFICPTAELISSAAINVAKSGSMSQMLLIKKE